MSLLAPSDPIHALITATRAGVLALISRTEGPSYRPIGAQMVVFDNGQTIGSLSSGCIESDITQHALDALETGRPACLLYGKGSPFFDLQLPCGGGLEVLILPRPDCHVLSELNEKRAAREPLTLNVDVTTGELSLGDIDQTGLVGNVLSVHFQPEVRFLIFGKGSEASCFAALTQSIGAPTVLLSPNIETLASSDRIPTQHLQRPEFPKDLHVDRRTAIVTFFHDHDWEPDILKTALETDAFYIGSQGSQRARSRRLLMLETLGVPLDALQRLKGPIGLIPSTRDATTLAVSVLADILADAQTRRL